MEPHPLFHKISLRNATKAVAIIYLVLFILSIVSGIILVSLEGKQIQMDIKSTRETAMSSKCLGIATIFAGAVGMIFSLVLLQGAITRCVWKIRMFLLLMLTSISGSIIEITKNPSSIIPHFVAIVLMTYCAWIIESFVLEIQSEQKSIPRFNTAK